MQTKREFLVELGLAKPGARGRFSSAAKAALDKAIETGMTFAEVELATPVSKPVKVKPQAKKIEGLVKQREQATVYGIDKAKKPGQKDLVIAFSSCDACCKPVQYCTHDVPKLPNWLSSEAYLVKPEV
jgi:hypothetical protein